MVSKSGPKCLVFDIETAPMLAYVWGKGEQHINLPNIKSDWYVIAWAAKWLGDPASKIIYRDQRGKKDIENDKELVSGLWKLLDEADIVITQNGKNFDSPKLNARFLTHGMPPPSPYKHLDTYQIVKKVAKFTASSLEYLSEKLCTKYKKLKHKKFPGFSLWKECLSGNQDAWQEMKTYNMHDVLATEELYGKLQAWDNSIKFDSYNDNEFKSCNCGSRSFIYKGYSYTTAGKYQRFKCTSCGKWDQHKKNLLLKKAA